MDKSTQLFIKVACAFVIVLGAGVMLYFASQFSTQYAEAHRPPPVARPISAFEGMDPGVSPDPKQDENAKRETER